MKKKTLAIIAAIVVVIVVAALFVFVKCDEKPQPKAPVEKEFLGGVAVSGASQQLFAKIFVNYPYANTPYKSKIEGIPDKLQLYTDNNIQDKYYEIQFHVSPPKGTEGKYPYKVTVYSEKDKYDFEGTLVVGVNTGSPDQLDGGCGRTGNLGNADLGSMSITSKIPLEKLMVANPVVCGSTCVIGTSGGEMADGKVVKGELIGFDLSGKQLWKVGVTKNTIESLQVIGDKIIVCDNSALISIFEVSKLARGEDRADQTYSASSNLSAPPTIISNDKMVIGTTDGNIVCLGLPDLSKQWSVPFAGTIMGSVAAIPVGEGNGSIYFNCTNNTTTVLNFDGSLQYYFKHDVRPIGSPAALSDKYAVITYSNQLQLHQNDGKEIWKHYSEFDLVGVPVINDSQVFIYGKNKLRAVSLDDGVEMWTIELPSAINANPVVIGNSLLVCTEDRTASIIRTNDGIISNTFGIDGSVIDWPFLHDGRVFIVDRRGSLVILSKSANASSDVKFDMSQVVANGGKCTVSHNCITSAVLPLKPKLLWSVKGSFAPAITTKTKIYLYNIDTKTFQCNNAIDGTVVWTFPAEAVDGVFFGFSLNQGFHETPMFFTDKGLLVGTKAGLVLLNPDTGKELTRSITTGIPQCDGKTIVLTSGSELVAMNMKMELLWKKKGTYYASNVIIDGDYIFAARRGDGTGEFEVIETKTGKVTFTFADKLFDISAVKVLTTGRYVVVTTMAGPWIYDKETASILGVSKNVSQFGSSMFESNYVNGKLICSTHDFGIEFDIKSAQGRIMLPKDAKTQQVFVNGGNWVFTPNGYVCMGLVTPKGKPTKQSDPHNFERKLQIRTMTSEITSSIIIEPSKIDKYGIALGGSTIILSEIGQDAKLRVYGP